MDLERLFYPRSIAVVGVSPNTSGDRIPFYHILKAVGYEGALYPVNPSYKEINGEKVYPSLEAIPGEVDFAIVVVAAKRAMDVLESAVRKRVKFMHFFTSGFSEVGNTDLESGMMKLARAGNIRIVGPNCIGVICPESKVTPDPTLKQARPGRVAFVGQSGGMTNDFMRMLHARNTDLNKAVSIGNQMDLRVEDYLEYFAEDDRVKVIAAYIEDIKDGRAFVDVLKRTTPKKPLAVLKGGRTSQGAKAAASHTGAMAVQDDVWSAVMRQHRCIEAQTMEQLADVAMIADTERIPTGPRLGYLGAGGGISVMFTDFAIMHGLALPELDKKTRDIIAEKIPAVNTSTTNPVDLGAFGLDHQILAHTMKAMDADDNIDVIIPYFSIDWMSIFSNDKVEKGVNTVIETARDIGKPAIPVLSTAAAGDLYIEKVRNDIFSKFRDAGFPAFKDIHSVIIAIRSILQWSGKR